MLCCALVAGSFAEALAISEPERIRFIEELITVADGEVGYTREANGYTKYADWSGGNKYGEWCSDFVSWCVAQADLRLSTNYLDYLYPMQTACAAGVRWYTAQGRYVTVAGKIKDFGGQWFRADGASLTERPYLPQRGDLIYFEWYKYNRIDHVGIVEYVEMDARGEYVVHTIEGNNTVNGAKVSGVERFAYPLEDPSIRAYGVTRDDVGTEMRGGSAGPLVEKLQRMLIESGYGDFRPDGTYGSHTVRAIRAVQKTYGFPVTGVADRLTQRALGFPFGDPLPTPTPVPTEPPAE
jgi:hypothetical protein